MNTWITKRSLRLAGGPMGRRAELSRKEGKKRLKQALYNCAKLKAQAIEFSRAMTCHSNHVER